ncbi:MAG: ATP-dependent helicase [Saprospiraceae bacterium]|nr:ATP-dependent helicase [Saprospiraceae bacterium]
MKRANYHKLFKEVLNTLNPAQLKAVTNTEGPVLAIAGPGTGKTHILTARIGQILLNTDAQANNVLCLTFTDAAVNAMRQRLLQFIGPEAHKVHIYTFHSFCNKVIQEHLDYFGQHDLVAISDLERIEIIREIIDSLDLKNPLRQNSFSPYYYERHLSDFFRRIKAEKWVEADLVGKIQEYIDDLPKRPEMLYKRDSGKNKKGDIKSGKYQEIHKKISLLTHAIPLFEKYNAALKKRKLYDFEDMVVWVIKAFEGESHILSSYQEQYLYFLVDEFQDTNGSQNEIIQLLVDYWGDNPNLFIVGDDDQSIYEFQGARIKNMTDFYQKYHNNLLLVLLEDNYRSSQLILDASRKCIKHNTNRIINTIDGLEFDKKMIGKNTNYASLTIPVEVIEYPNQLQEEIALVQKMESLNNQGVMLKDMAIVFAKHKQAKNLISIFEKRKIPYQTKRRINILELPIVHNLRKLLAYITNEYKTPYSSESIFFEFLHYDFLGISASDASKLTSWMTKQRQSTFINRDDRPLTWRDLIRNTKTLQSIGLEDIEKIISLSIFFDNSIHKYNSLPLPILFEWIINHCGLIQFIESHHQKFWLIQVINSLFEFVKEESTKNNLLDLEGLLNLLEMMISNRIGLELFEIKSNEKGVNLVTAHSAKGLEFEYVFMINANEEMWGSSKQPYGRFHFPDTLTFSDESDQKEAKRRLFYVAMTRAKKSLQISYYQENINNKLKPRVNFLDELLESDETYIRFSKSQANLSGEWQQLLLSKITPPPLIPLLEKGLLSYILDGFKLSVSAMNSYIMCPLGFYYERILRLPSIYSVEAAYGIAIHNAIKRTFDFAINKNNSTLPSVSVFIDFFTHEMKKQRIYLTPSSFKERISYGKEVLPLYYLSRKEEWEKSLQEGSVLAEKTFLNVEFDGVPLKGTIDKIEFLTKNNAKKIHIVDYKTGKYNKTHLTVPKKSTSLGGLYWRQLIFYKILLENSGLTTDKVISAEIDYLTPNQNGQFLKKYIEFNSNEVEFVKKMIVDTYNKIMSHQFTPGCDNENCKWCNFSKHNLVPDQFDNEQTSALDDK